jgi:hypothetical protein
LTAAGYHRSVSFEDGVKKYIEWAKDVDKGDEYFNVIDSENRGGYSENIIFLYRYRTIPEVQVAA